MVSKKRTHKAERLARVYDDEILPVWSHRFGRMLLRDLELPDRCQILDLACATGYPAVEIIRRMGAGSRFIAIDASSALLDVARRKVEEMGAKGVFFRSESAGTRLPFADDVYHLVLCNLDLGDMPDRAAALADYARVAVPGGEVRCTLPLEGSFEEFHDIYREVLTKHDKHETLARLDEHVARVYPSAAECEEWLRVGPSARRAGRGGALHHAVPLLARVLLRPGHRVRPAVGVEGDRRHRPGDAGHLLVHQGGDRRLLRGPRVRCHASWPAA